MAFEQTNVPLAGDILDDLAQAFREIINKVCFNNHFFLYKTSQDQWSIYTYLKNSCILIYPV